MNIVSIFLQTLVGGIGIGSLYALVALGFVMIFRATNVVNFAQGEFSMLGAYFLFTLWHGLKLDYFAAIVVALLIMVGVGLLFEHQASYKADLWYGVSRLHWRKGIATEAVRAVMQFGFETLRLHRINVDTRMDNAASVALMRTLGFQHEGTRRECGLNADGTYHSWGLFGMLEAEYAR